MLQTGGKKRTKTKEKNKDANEATRAHAESAGENKKKTVSNGEQQGKRKTQNKEPENRMIEKLGRSTLQGLQEGQKRQPQSKKQRKAATKTVKKKAQKPAQ